jgi:diguanylate cyclase (GGDEF)-like protein
LGSVVGKTLEFLAHRKEGDEFPIEISFSAVHIRDQWHGIGIVRDVSERKKAEAELTYIAYHDTLTGLYNRKAFVDRLKESLSYAKRYRKELALLYVDLDGFKSVNDIHGHETGDELLKTVAVRLKDSLRQSDYVYRMGGDEFTALLNNPTSIHPETVAQRILTKISEPYRIAGHEIDHISASIGISAYPKDGRDVQSLIKCADTAMYKAKQTGSRYLSYDSVNGTREGECLLKKAQGC